MNKEEKAQTCTCGDSKQVIHKCANCNSQGTKVSAITLKAQLKKEKFENIKNSKDEFNFCNTPKCDIVYYSNDGKEFYTQEDVRVKVAVKNDDLQTPLCYCRRLLKQNVFDMINNKEEDIAKKVFDIISSGKSVCEKTNPRGVCCTEDIRNFLADYGIDFEQGGTCGDSSCGTTSNENCRCDNSTFKEKSSCC